jgi:peptidoglycan/LPS O-acetylase OafA/YrhL
MTHKRRIWLLSLLAVTALLAFPAAAFASGDDVGQNVANLLKGYASEMYVGVVAVVSVVFLANRRYNELGLFLFATVVVAWMVFDPSDIASAGESIGKQIFG